MAMANVTDTEHFLRWIEAQPTPPKRFLLPTPLQAGVLAAMRLRFNVFHGQPLSPKGHEEKACIKNGWLELRESKELALTKQGRAVLDAVIAMGWQVPK